MRDAKSLPPFQLCRTPIYYVLRSPADIPPQIYLLGTCLPELRSHPLVYISLPYIFLPMPIRPTELYSCICKTTWAGATCYHCILADHLVLSSDKTAYEW